MGSRNSCKNFPECIDIVLNRRINIEGIISKVIDFEKVPMIINDIYKNPANYMKVVAVI